MSQTFNTAATNKLFRALVLLVLGLTLFKAALASIHVSDRLILGDNDDMMRLLSIRDWLGGQGWLDMRQYRMVPPEGLDLHWSRYLDLAIASILWPLMQVLPVDLAETITLIVWPTLLLVILTLMTARTGCMVLGPMAGVAALFCLVIWSPTGQTYFVPSRLDHHNVQIVLSTLMVFALISPGRGGLTGAVAGLAAAASLAIGLETLVTVAIAGLILVMQLIMRHPASERRLVGFCLTLLAASLLFFLGQTPADQWYVPRCDEMSLPFLALAATGAGICLIMVAAAGRLPNIAMRAALFLLLAAGGIAVLLPLLGPCISGPYGDLPAEAQHIIAARISEAKSAIPELLRLDPAITAVMFPAYAVVVVSTIMWVMALLRGSPDKHRQAAVAILLVFGWLGVIASLFQARLMLMGAPAVPLLTGYVLSPLMLSRTSPNGAPAPSIALVAGLAVLFVPPILINTFQSDAQLPAVAVNAIPTHQAPAPDGVDTQPVRAYACRLPEIIETLSNIPSAVILSSSNYGPPILVLTDHKVLTGPYHRSPDAMIDGVLPFDGEEARMRETLKRTKADYLLLCRYAIYGHAGSFATTLAAGQPTDGLIPVEGVHDKLLLLRVDRP